MLATFSLDSSKCLLLFSPLISTVETSSQSYLGGVMSSFSFRALLLFGFFFPHSILFLCSSDPLFSCACSIPPDRGCPRSIKISVFHCFQVILIYSSDLTLIFVSWQRVCKRCPETLIVSSSCFIFLLHNVI